MTIHISDEMALTTESDETLMVVAAPTHHDIAARAFDRYLERGGADGRDLDDWLDAERELLIERHEDASRRR